MGQTPLVRTVVFITLVLLLVIPQPCSGFNNLFAFEDPFGPNNYGHVAELTLPTDQDGLVFQLHRPLHLYGRTSEKIGVFKNGFIALDGESAQSCPKNYPENSLSDGYRLKHFGARYLSIYSSVNDGPSGKITVRDIDLNTTESLGCANRRQLKRIQQLISLRYPRTKNFRALSIVWITWENMTNAQYQNSKSNSYSIMLLDNGEETYAVFQYWNIEWPDIDVSVSNAAPPEAGAFIPPSNGYQLPRSGHSVNISKWMSESNVALPGEWLLPLYNAPVESDKGLDWLPRITEEFLNSFNESCQENGRLGSRNMFGKRVAKIGTEPEVLNDYPNAQEAEMHSVSTDWDQDSYTDDLDDDFDFNESGNLSSTENFWSSYHEQLERIHGGSATQMLVTPTESRTVTEEYFTIEPRIVPQSIIPLGVTVGNSSTTDEPFFETRSYIPASEHTNTGRYGSAYPTEGHRAVSHGLVRTERCDPYRECKATNSDCYRLQEKICCVCKEGFYGSGDIQCWNEDDDSNFAFRGNLTINLTHHSGNRNLPIYLDVQTGRSKRSSSGVRNGIPDDSGYQVVRLLTPMFHVLNGIFASPCQNQVHPEHSRPYSLFTLGGAFRDTFRLQFHFDVQHVGKFTATARLRLEPEASPAYSKGIINVDIVATEPTKQTERTYREASNVGERNFYASYQVDTYGRIIFPEKSVQLVPESRATADEELALDELTVRWSAVAEAEPLAGAVSSCLLHRDSTVPRDRPFYLRLQDRGYCSEDCASKDGTCNLFCVDVPLLSSTEPDVCSCITCPTEGEICVAEGGTYYCQCRPGLQRMHDHTCRADTIATDPAYQQRQCGSVNCHEDARCIDSAQSFCQCVPGFRGDGVSRCEEDPCARCQRNEICVNDICKPSGVDLCEGIQCGKQAVCRDGACVCNAGYTGDPLVECIEERELCAGVQCHRFGQCYQNRCYCSHGYVGDGVNFCDVHTVDPCEGIRCAANGVCQDGRCSCSPGYEGDGYNQCNLIENRCSNIQCHAQATCVDGQCQCNDGYEGDGYRECRSKDPCAGVACHPYAVCTGGICRCIEGYEGDGHHHCQAQRSTNRTDGQPRAKFGSSVCIEQDCHPYAHCVEDRCVCRHGYEGDGYLQCKQLSVGQQSCGQCRGIPLKELAQCIDGQCVCAPGYVEAHPGVCMECVQSNCHPNALCLQTPTYNNTFSCQCKSGYVGDGVKTCQALSEPRPEQPTIDPTCGGTCTGRNTECNRYTGVCECRRGYDWDGRSQCVWNCQLCIRDAICDRQNERCACRPGYYGDGQTYCEPLPTRPDPVKVHIAGQGEVYRLTDLERPLVLHCYVTTNDESVTGQWSQPKGAQMAEISINRLANGTEMLLRISKPSITDAGRYFCRAGQAEAFIDVAIEETAIPYDIFLTSDDGILKVRSSNQNSTMATLWNLAENNKYGRVAMVTDCNSQRVIYTSDYGHSLRWGDAHLRQKELTTVELYQSQLSRYRSLAVDPPSGNIFAWDEAYGKLVVLNPAKPHMRYTLDAIGSFKQAEPVRFAGVAVHSTRGLLYWATFTDGWMPNGTIQVASMTGENEGQLIQLNGEPLALSLSPSYDSSDSSAGRICWIQRSIINMFALTTEMHCARLSSNGREVIMQERLRQFGPTEEPSWGMIHHRGTVLWTDATRPVYYSANPSRRVLVRLVCCSNRFQSIAALAKCEPALNNACSYSNGRCRYFCLPNEDQRSRTCVCPDSEIGCHKEV